MSDKVRLLPVIAIVALGTFAVKAVAIAEAAGESVAQSQAGHSQEAETGHEAPAHVESQMAEDYLVKPVTDTSEVSTQAPAEVCSADELLAEQSGLSQYEIQVLRKLSERRSELDDRESQLDTRELTVSAAELRLNDQIDELKRLEDSIQGLLGEIDEKNEEQLASLVKVYETMKPKDAGRIFDTLDDGLLLSLADRMKPAAVAAILPSMEPDRARTLTTLMAAKTEPPRTIADLEARTGGR